ncbi:hypothetical protein ACS86_16340 [Vibrio alginolyticus]|nr:hypothetical protein ACS86_16340 [Vibrio alginolyticus]
MVGQSHVGMLTTEALRSYPVVVVRDTSQHISPQDTLSLTGQKVIYAPELTTAINMNKHGIAIGYITHHRIKGHLDQGLLIKKAMVEHKQPTQLFYAW